jgi:membrane-bound lytic murein transglycosylase D
MKKLFATLLSVMTFSQLAYAYPAANMDEGYLYWSQRYSLENVSPLLCLSDSAASLNRLLSRQSLNTDIAVELEANCGELMFMAGVLPEMSKNMNQSTRGFFRDNYGIAMYLSGLNPLKQGLYHKSGWWLLSYPVALKYGLRIDENVDERQDPVRASEAAYHYYTDLYKQFKDEDLTILAFVTSPIEAKSAQADMAAGRALSTKHEKLLVEIKSLRESFNWLIERMPFTVTVENEALKTLEIERDIQLAILLDELEIGLDDFMRYNPMVTGNVVPANYGGSVLLPAKDLEKFRKDSVEYKSVMFRDEEVANLWDLRERIKKNVPDPRTSRQVVYRVKSGDNLGKISERYSVSISKIKTWNSLRTDVIYIGQKLTVFQPKSAGVKSEPKTTTQVSSVSNTPVKSAPPKKKTVQEEVPKDEPKSVQKMTSNPNDYLYYTVKSGDTMYGIARGYPGVSAENIMAWNNASTNIQVGQKLKIKKSEIRK